MSVPTIEQRLRAHLAKHPHATASEIGRALNVSRQRVHEAAQRYGLTLAKASRPATLTRFACPACGLEVWTVPQARLLCGVCEDDRTGKPVELFQVEPTSLRPAASAR